MAEVRRMLVGAGVVVAALWALMFGLFGVAVLLVAPRVSTIVGA